jgi:hypothetical protein
MISEEKLNNMNKEELIKKIRELEEKNEILEIKINNYSNSYFSILYTLDNILQQTGYKRMTDISKSYSNNFYM